MLKNYLKIAVRNLWNRKVYSALNIAGLAIGLSACLTIVFYVRHEFTYDGHHENAGRIVRITTKFETPDSPMMIASTPVLLASTLSRDYPEIKKTTRFQIIAATVKNRLKVSNEDHIYLAEQSAFDIFSFKFLEGSVANALTRPGTAVLTESLSSKYFGPTAIGKTITINKKPYEITAVISDLPSNSHMKISAMLSTNFADTRDWLSDDFPAYTFALFKKTPDLTAFSRKLDALCDRYIQPELKASGAEGYKLVFEPELLADVHYSQDRLADLPKGNKQFGYLFAFLAAFVLLIAVLNYINLLTASATERSKEVGVRKATGAQKGQLVGQFLFESFFVSSIAVIFSVAILSLATPALNDLLQIKLVANWKDISLVAGVSLIVVTLLGGAYPSFVLSNFRPVLALKGTLSPDNHSTWLRKGITLFQFSLAVAMIFGVIVISRQMQYLQNHNPGFEKDQVVMVSVPDDSIANSKIQGFATLLRQESKIENVTVGTGDFRSDATLPKGTTIFKSNGKKREVMGSYFFIDEHFIPCLNMKLLEGRNLSSKMESDKNEGFIVNEAFVKMSGLKDPIGHQIEGFMHKGQIIGVVRNFNYMSLHNKVEPLLMVYNSFRSTNIMVKTKPENLKMIENTWKNYYPDFPFEYSFLDSNFEAQYRKDHVMMVLFDAFAFLTVFVSCLGLLSLIIFSTRMRMKEIGIRKVLGASVFGIIATLSRAYFFLIILAVFIASPVAYYAMGRWLETFAYRIEMTWWMLAASGMIAITLAFLTISYQSIRAALMNPVKSLRSE